MKTEKLSIILVAAALLPLLGCSTAPIPTSEATPTESVHNSSYATVKPGTGEVVIKRDTGFTGAACTVQLSIDGSRIADLDRGEKVVMHLPEGDHTIGAASGGFFCSGTATETEVIAKAGATRNFRVGYTAAGNFFIGSTAD